MGQTPSLNNVFKAVQSPYAIVRALLDGHETLRQRAFTSTAVQHTPLKITFEDLPNELLLLIFSFLELKPYIVSHGVCKRWKQLLPVADIHPIRRRMFNLFHLMLQHPRFLETRPRETKTKHAFDREAYINALLAQYPAIPEDFRLWILEWPARMAIFFLWPGLPFMSHGDATLEHASGVNWLSYLPEGRPCLLGLIHKHPSHSDHFIPALLLRKDSFRVYWLIFEKDEADLFGRVMAINHDSSGLSVFCKSPFDEEDDETVEVYGGWMDFLEQYWTVQLEFTLSLPPYPLSMRTHELMKYPVPSSFGSWQQQLCPSHPWVLCSDPRIQEELL